MTTTIKETTVEILGKQNKQRKEEWFHEESAEIYNRPTVHSNSNTQQWTAV